MDNSKTTNTPNKEKTQMKQTIKKIFIGFSISALIMGGGFLGVLVGIKINENGIYIQGLNMPQSLKKRSGKELDFIPTCSQKNEFWNSGSIKIRTTKEGEKDCVVEEFWESGAIKKRTLIVNDKIKKQWKFNFEGILNCRTIFLDNNQSEETCYMPSNPTQISSLTNYSNGVKNGTSFSYHANGQIRSVQEYNGGIKEGEHKFFDESGVLERQIDYNNGEGIIKINNYQNRPLPITQPKLESTTSHQKQQPPHREEVQTQEIQEEKVPNPLSTEAEASTPTEASQSSQTSEEKDK